MPHWKTLLDPSIYLGPQDFPTDKEVTISRMASEKVGRPGEVQKLGAMMYIIARDGSEVKRPLKLSRLVMRGMGIFFGSHDYKNWPGKKITLFATMCLYGGERVECVRARFPADVEAQIRSYAKANKISPKAYMLTDASGAPEAYTPTEPPADDPQVAAGIGQP